MADVTALQVIDTAVKIGLGAAIAGVSAIIVARHNHSHELKSLRYQRRLDTIEKVAEVANKHFAVVDSFLGAVSVAYDHIPSDGGTFTETDRKFLEQSDNHFMASVFQLKESAARLRLLGEAEAYKAISSYMKVVAAFRNRLIVDEQTPDRASYESVVSDVMSSRKAIYKALSTCYSQNPR
jgi:hypothetical protein